MFYSIPPSPVGHLLRSKKINRNDLSFWNRSFIQNNAH